MEERKSKKQRIYLIVGIVLFLILVLSASYAYFAITSVNNTTATTVTGTGEELGTPTLTTNTTSLGIDLTAEFMTNRNNRNKRLYATPSGDVVIENTTYPRNPTATTPVEIGNGRYKLATVSVAGGSISYDCTYSFDVSGTITAPVNDKSDQDINVVVTSPKGETYTYRLDQLLAGTKTISGVINNLTPGEDQVFTIETYLYVHHAANQNDLTGKTYTITVTPKSGTTGFSCTTTKEPEITGFAKNLINSNKLKQTGLEGDGYRFVGTGTAEYCLYDNGNYSLEKSSDGTCPTLYNYIATNISTGVQNTYSYHPSCPTSTTTTTYSECITKTATLGNIPVDNYICFGTTDKSTCTNNPDKYMYRIIGVLPDEYGNQHVKLLKSTSIGDYQWHNEANEIDFHDTTLYKGLNGSYFYTNTTYDYMQNSTWRNKITNWKWSETTDQIFLRGNGSTPGYITPMDYSSMGNGYNHQQETYLHELNRGNKRIKFGYWTYITARIGLIYASDFALSLPIVEGYSNSDNDYHGYTSWMNFGDDYDSWTIARRLYTVHGTLTPFDLHGGNLEWTVATQAKKVNPTFYLNSDVELESGSGTSTDPYILK